MKSTSSRNSLQQDINRLLAGRHHDPFDVLGCHRQGRQWHVRALLPGTAEAEVVIDGKSQPMERLPQTDFFTFKITAKAAPDYHLRWRPAQGDWREGPDPYRFGPTVGDLDLHLFAEGKHEHIYRVLGAQRRHLGSQANLPQYFVGMLSQRRCGGTHC